MKLAAILGMANGPHVFAWHAASPGGAPDHGAQAEVAWSAWRVAGLVAAAGPAEGLAAAAGSAGLL
jgi:hypothetical protein